MRVLTTETQRAKMDENLDDLLNDLIMEEQQQQPAHAQVEEETLDNLLGTHASRQRPGQAVPAWLSLSFFFFFFLLFEQTT